MHSFLRFHTLTSPTRFREDPPIYTTPKHESLHKNCLLTSDVGFCTAEPPMTVSYYCNKYRGSGRKQKKSTSFAGRYRSLAKRLISSACRCVVAVHLVAPGTSRHFVARRQFGRFRSKADICRRP